MILPDMYNYLRRHRYKFFAVVFVFLFSWGWIFLNTGPVSLPNPSSGVMLRHTVATGNNGQAFIPDAPLLNRQPIEGVLTQARSGVAGDITTLQLASEEEYLTLKPFRIYVYDLPPRFNRDLAACVQKIDTCFQLDENFYGMGPELIGNKSTVISYRDTHQFSLEVILHHKMLQSEYRTLNTDEADLFYIPFYPGIACFCRSYQKGSFDLKSLHQDLWRNITSTSPYFEVGKPHVMALGKIEREQWSDRCGILREYNYANRIQFIGIEEEYKKAYRSYFNRSEQQLLVAPYPSYGHFLETGRELAEQPNFSNLPSATERKVFAFMAASSSKNHEVRAILKAWLYKTDQDYETYLKSNPTEDRYEGVWYVTPECDHSTKLPTIQWMQHSVFCLQPPGDSPTRKSFYDAAVTGCIPVTFLPEHLLVKYPFQRFLNYSEFTVNFGLETFLAENEDIVELLKEIPEDEIERLRENLAKISPFLQYSYPSTVKSHDAFHMILKELGAIFKL
ncbi:uncharacterized protein [Ptychodera flava]|uniref:uncharacterized protein n=1 Tax=Ptychodera flava TaxID=63121 RepID=UPI00396A20E4